MKKAIKIALVLTSVFSLASCGEVTSTSPSTNDETYVIKDALNREVEIKKNPESFVCLGPGCLRQYCYVGDTSKIVGIEHCEITSNIATKPYLSSIEHYTELPIIGEGGPKDTTNKEKLLEVHPDIVFSSYVSSVQTLDQLAKQTGLAVVAVGYNSNGLFAEDIYSSLKLIGKIVGREKRATDVVNYFEDSKKELQTIASKNKTTKTGYLGCVNHRGSHGIDYTTGDFPVFDVLGIKNIIHEKNIKSFAQIDKEVITELQPDVIIIDAGGLTILKEDMKKHPSFYDNLNAFKNNNVYVELPTVYYSCNFDVALANAYYIGSVFYPDEFKNFDIKTKFNEITKTLLGVETYDLMTSYLNVTYGKLDK